MIKMSIRLKLTILLLFLFASAIGNVFFTFILEKYGEEKLQWVIHTHEVISLSNAFLSSMSDAETGQRGYLLTGDITYLEPYHRASVESQVMINELLEKTLDNEEQQTHLKIIQKNVNKKFDELQNTIDLKQNGELKKALDIVESNVGKEVMDTIRVELSTFIHHENILLEKRKGDFRESRAILTTLLIIEMMVFIFLAFITFFFVHGSLFNPLKLLLSSTAKMEKGEKQDISALLPNDEMGYLLSRFYKMSNNVLEKTESLNYQATHDELTGLRNRVDIHNEINNAIMYLENTNRKIGIIFIDLNKFKPLNDSLGHDAGDFILKETAERLMATVRSNDVVFRYGGDEFVIVVKRFDNFSQLENLAKKILSNFKSTVQFRGNTIEISLSMGIAISPDDSISSDEILNYADIAMYEAKRDDRTDYKFFESAMAKRSIDRLKNVS